MKLTMSEKYMFCNQMAMILESGFSLNQGVTMVYEEMDDKNIKGVLQEVAKYLDEQVSFSEAINLTKAFDDYMVNLVKVGETSGNLDDVMQSLSEYYARIDDITNKLKQALTYPIILIIMMVVVVGIIVFKVLPIFKDVLNGLGSDLSSYANSFMEFGQIFSLICFAVLLVLVIVIIAGYLYQRITHVNVLSSVVQKSFLTRKLSRALNKAQITYALSLFISSGYDLQEAMKFVPKLVDDKQLRANLEKCNEDLINGDSFVEVIKKYQIYQGMQLNMIQVGFKTGQVDIIMKQLLFLLFVIGSFFIVTYEIKGYQVINDTCQQEDDLIVPLAYLNTKLKANDSDDSTKIVEIDNTQCLEIKTAKTVTYIYCQDGYLKELYTSNDYHAGLQEGSKLFALDDFKIEQKDRLFKFTVTRDQVSKSISIYLHG